MFQKVLVQSKFLYNLLSNFEKISADRNSNSPEWILSQNMCVSQICLPKSFEVWKQDNCCLERCCLDQYDQDSCVLSMMVPETNLINLILLLNVVGQIMPGQKLPGQMSLWQSSQENCLWILVKIGWVTAEIFPTLSFWWWCRVIFMSNPTFALFGWVVVEFGLW